MNLIATYFSHRQWLQWGKWLLRVSESLEQSRSQNTGRPVNRRRSRCHRQRLSRCTDHKPCMKNCRLETSSLGRHWSNQSQSCPNDMLHTSSNQVKNFVINMSFIHRLQDKLTKVNSLQRCVRMTLVNSQNWNNKIKKVILPSIISPKCQCDAK